MSLKSVLVTIIKERSCTNILCNECFLYDGQCQLIDSDQLLREIALKRFMQDFDHTELMEILL